MSSALLVINTLLVLSFGPFRGASNLIRETVSNEKGSSQGLNGTNSFVPFPCSLDKTSSAADSQISLKDNNEATNFRNTDVQAHFDIPSHHHQIHKRNLNRDFPMKRTVTNQVQSDPSSKQNFFEKDLTDNDPNGLTDFVNKIVLNGKINLDETRPFSKYNYDSLQSLNDTTKISTDNFVSNDNRQMKELNKDLTVDNSYSQDDIYFVNNQNDDVNTIDVFSLDENKDRGFKRETGETITNSSCDTMAIKDEIDKVYKDISDNVRLLSKLRDKESLLMKRPSNKRWVIVDNTISDSGRKKKCAQELTVEMDTNRDATPDRLEHIERKIEEEILQVNVPLRCNHS